MMKSSTGINVNNRRAKKIISDLPEHVIDSVTFHPFSLEDQTLADVCNINNKDSYSAGGVNDPKMGVSEKDQECETCHQSTISCTGHQGSIKLNKPIINPRFLKNVIFVLKCVCNYCGELLVSEDDINAVKIRGPGRLKALADRASNVCTSRLGSCLRNPTFMVKKSKNLHFLMRESCIKVGQEKVKIHLPMHVEEIMKILDLVSKKPEQLHKLGFTGKTKPIDYIIQKFNVISLCNRSPHHFGGGAEPQDDPLTISYKDLVGKNEKLDSRNIKEMKSYKRTEIERDLWNHAIHIMDNSDGTNKHGKPEPVKGIKERLTDKNGLARGSQIKRNNYTGRTVAGPSHSSSLIHVEVPDIFRSRHTVLEKVSRYNIRKILDLFDKGEISSITYSEGPKKDKEYIYQSENADHLTPPSIGDTVRRWGMNGDFIMFGRNPTLSKFSNVSAMVKYVKKKTIGISCPKTKQFNLDFDGDESHLNMMQGIGARVEAKTIMNVKNCIMSFKDCKPNIALFYNCLSSGYLLSSNNAGKIDLEDYQSVCERLVEIDYIPGTPRKDFTKRLKSLFERLDRHGIDRSNPTGLFSLTLPENFHYNTNGLKIEDGVLISGSVSAKNIGCSKKSIIHVLYNNYGGQVTMDFITEINYILEYYLYRRGLTITYRHIASSNISEIQEKISSMKSFIQRQIDALHSGNEGLCERAAASKRQEIEYKTYNLAMELSTYSDRMVFENISHDNPLRVMADSGAKGSSRNSMQICGALGQQFMYGRLPEKIITNGERCSPFHRVGSTDIAATGFIENSFMTGLSPCEMFFHIMAARVNLIDTSVKTSETGHFSRKAHKFLEDYVIEYDGSVRGAGGRIVSFVYLDGFAVESTIQTRTNELGEFCSPIDVDWICDHINKNY